VHEFAVRDVVRSSLEGLLSILVPPPSAYELGCLNGVASRLDRPQQSGLVPVPSFVLPPAIQNDSENIGANERRSSLGRVFPAALHLNDGEDGKQNVEKRHQQTGDSAHTQPEGGTDT
jgi:hypothetical protein